MVESKIKEKAVKRDWLNEDVFIEDGQRYYFTPDCRIVPLPSNGNKNDNHEH